MSDDDGLRIDGEALAPCTVSRAQLAGISAVHQVPDVSAIDPKRRGRAIRLAGVLALVQPKPSADYLTLHSSTDDFHASVPLASVRDRAILIYELDGQPLPRSAGGPFRFFIPDFAACRSQEVDECANVKFVDRIELTCGKGRDNRPEDEQDHAALHEHSPKLEDEPTFKHAMVHLPPGQQLAAAGKWPTVGERAPKAANGPWQVAVAGLVERTLALSLADLRALPQASRAIDIHCVTRWSKLGARFAGPLLADVLQLAIPRNEAHFVYFTACSPRMHGTSLPLHEALSLGVLLALDYEGQPLEELHGGPVRVVTPQRYFYKSLKWLCEIELLAEDRLGYWEAEAGYHNRADPCREERYRAADLDPQWVQRLLAARDLSGQSLLGLAAAGLDLRGLTARGAVLRNADFRDCNLAGACFDGANLSNAHFARADLRGASFRDADAEGADFSGANLQGVDFANASLLGASF